MREVRYAVSDGVATLVIDRPAKRGAMTYAMLAALHDAIDAASTDSAVRVLIITGTAGSFCAGTDLAELATRPAAERGRTRREDPEMAVLRCAKPVIAAVDGPAVGMGAEFTCQADLRLASSNARFSWNFAHRGLVPDTGAGSWLLPRQIGMAAALRLLYTGDYLDAAQASELGYVLEVVTPERLWPTTMELANRIAAVSPFAATRIKRLVYDGAGTDLPSHLRATQASMAECFASADHAEGVAAFLERREPQFTGG
ncbi:short chain enoyl-CoA hydratase /enoyl-CoA hydratase [Tamaricihabitans halophyticus]|uniref:Short chain enoyl-CoA hydratase /enoyl-CoA hydratase n=1 Tax=Tamaricihabitans halophyticus TaxID=1262583 RepID=A0A4R2QWC2_9PSEU|nr:enoyl-CoA hydratase-related protein [Tamaricihabitans halophyticus]TCP53564.1 short chain enoyl-CoA hydratase /enoyl-CoA hydratase [Tamaricihabitans halophyticus]